MAAESAPRLAQVAAPFLLPADDAMSDALIRERQHTAEHQQFQRLLDAYLRALNAAALNDKSSAAVADEHACKILEAREALYEWARPAVETKVPLEVCRDPNCEWRRSFPHGEHSHPKT